MKPRPLNLKSPGKKQFVHLLLAGYDYGSDRVLDVFLNKETADRVYEKIISHINKEPIPSRSISEMTDAEFDRYKKNNDKWLKGMPYGTKYDSYNIIEKELK